MELPLGKMLLYKIIRNIFIEILKEGIHVADAMGKNTIKHEFGHSKQSLYLGPLYLLLVGIPSFLMSMLTILHILRPDRYYKRWPENWANSLGEVKRL